MSATKYVLWVIPDRGGGWTSRATARSLEEAETMRGRLYRELGDVTVRILMKGEHPTRCLDVKHSSRDLPEDGAARAKQLRASADAAWERGNKDLSEALHAQARELEDGAA